MEPVVKDTKTIAKLVIGSIAGLCFFMLPFQWNGEMTIPLSFLKDLISAPLKPALPAMVMVITILSALLSLAFKLRKNNEQSGYVNALFAVTNTTLLVRILAAAVTVLAFFKIGPSQIWGEYTGGLIVFILMPSLLVLFFLASTMLPLLTEYGAMELIGSAVQPIFKPLFRIPGRSAILALSSWFGSGTIGMLTTDEEYKKGNFTGREAATICMGFGTITLPSMFIYTTSIAGLEVSTFSFFFLTLIVVTVVSAMIICRIPPLSRITDDLFPEAAAPTGQQKLSAFDSAYLKAKSAPSLPVMLKNGVLTSVRLYMNVFPLIIFLATAVLVITEHTPLFTIIATPLVPVLNAIGLPEAEAAAPAFLTGFADLLLPFLAATNIESQLAKFVICVVAIMQVICMSETGAVMLKADMPIKFHTLVFVFLEKTVIAILIALFMGRMFGLS